jgi:RNase P/RNase MRP subunit p30
MPFSEIPFESTYRHWQDHRRIVINTRSSIRVRGYVVASGAQTCSRLRSGLEAEPMCKMPCGLKGSKARAHLKMRNALLPETVPNQSSPRISCEIPGEETAVKPKSS